MTVLIEVELTAQNIDPLILRNIFERKVRCRYILSYILRTQKNRVFNDSARLKIASQSFNIDAARLWNLGPASITESVTITLAKKAIRTFVKTLPI